MHSGERLNVIRETDINTVVRYTLQRIAPDGKASFDVISLTPKMI